MKGYKAFNKDLTCRDIQYEVGKIYEMSESPVCCKRGFHFCKNIADVYNFYSMSDDTRICEVVSLGEVVSDDNVKFCTNKIKIIREIKSKAIKHCNVDETDVGYRNSGDCNSGNWNSGAFNTCQNPTIKMFDKESDWTINDWNNSMARIILADCPYTYSDFVEKTNMTDKEKAKYPEYKTIGGYVKTFIATKEDKQKWWDSLSADDKQKCYELPNFDADKFVECLGIEHI